MDYNAYCSGHTDRTDYKSAIAAFSDNFYTEAAAFGVETGVTKNGFPVSGYVWTDPSMLNRLPMLDETPPVKSILKSIEHFQPDETILLKANCPYSVLASLVEPSLFYRWLRRNKNEVHNALYTITIGLASYLVKALRKGVTLLSLADPYADMKTLGKECYNEFAAYYLVSLLNRLLHNKANTSGLIHLCPYNSIALEELNLVTTSSKHIHYDRGDYIGLIDYYIKNTPLKNIVLTGHHCIYAVNTGTIVFLNMNTNYLIQKRSMP
jgi:uroporphyrinogen-III decarboxylase